MALADLDVMLNDVSYHMARSQLSRQLSGNSSNGSTTIRKRAAKVTKANSVGNSPHAINRRKTIAPHTRMRNSSGLQHEAARTQDHNSWHSNGDDDRQRGPERPMSWHPASTTLETPAETYLYHNLLRENVSSTHLANSGVIAPRYYTDFIMSNGSDFTHKEYDQSNLNYGISPLSNGTSSAYASADTATQSQFPNMPLSYGYGTCTSGTSQTQDFSHVSAMFPTYIAPSSPDFLPIQYPLDPWQEIDIDSTTRIQKKRSKELVGMGLYDHGNSTQSHALTQIAHLQREPLGKGLKLEETWQPPKGKQEEEEDDDDEEDDSSIDDAEDGSPMLLPGKDDIQATSYPTCSDLSDQTFFFENDDQYFNFLAFEKAMAVSEAAAAMTVSETTPVHAGTQFLEWF
ncbi:hypothetical protein MMC12_000938 [Toensbergia leucococca]|nr:hypothetical protein [Toensbergia leucococca]